MGVWTDGCAGFFVRRLILMARGGLGGFSHIFALLCMLLSAVGCIEVPPPPAKNALNVRDIKVSDGLGLETACTPTGVEVCFDARDNNCNGVLEEGCGLRTGIL